MMILTSKRFHPPPSAEEYTILFMFFLQITYHELESFNGDSSSVFVSEPYFPMSNLLPGRNYSIAVQAVSKGIESVERSIFQATSEY